MTTKTIYTCDLCKKEQDTDEQFWAISISIDHFPVRSFSPNIHVHSCRECIDRIGFLSSYKTTVAREKEGKVPPTSAESLEALIQTMVDESVEWAIDNR